MLEKDSCFDALKSYKERLTLALTVSKVCIFEIDLQRQWCTSFDNAEAVFGILDEKILSDICKFSRLSGSEYQKAVAEYLAHPDDVAAVKQGFQAISEGEVATYNVRMKAGEGDYTWCKVDVGPIFENGIPVKMVGAITNINYFKAQLDKMERSLQTDSFTGLYSKNYAVNFIKELLSKEGDENHALVLIDLDHFKGINDTYGHLQGDQVLKTFSEHLQKLFRKSDIVGRFGGDEFIVLLRDIKDKAVLISKVKAILQTEHCDFSVDKSIGIALYPRDGRNFEELFLAADHALYKAKEKGNNYLFYER